MADEKKFINPKQTEQSKAVQPFIMPTGWMSVDILKEVAGDFAYITAFNMNLLDSIRRDQSREIDDVIKILLKYKNNTNAFGKAFNQLQTMDTEQTKEVYAVMIDRFDLDNDSREEIIESLAALPMLTMTEVIETIHLVKAIVAIIKQPAENFFARIGKVFKLERIIRKQSHDIRDLIENYKEAIAMIRKRKQQKVSAT